MTNATLTVLYWGLYEQGIPKSHIAQRLGKHRETIHIWTKGSQGCGLVNFLDKYHQANKGERKKRQVAPIVKRLVWIIREREYDCCGQKIQYFLNLEHDIHLSAPEIYEILSEKYIIRSKRKKNQERGQIPKASKPEEIIQMDTIDLGGLFAFAAIDILTKEADILLAPELTARFGCDFPYRTMERRFGGHVHLLQTDGGPEFEAEFTSNVRFFCDRHRVARPYRKNEQSYIESFNRTARKECLSWQNYCPDELRECTILVESFLKRCHYYRPHMGLNMTPPLIKKEVDCRISMEN